MKKQYLYRSILLFVFAATVFGSMFLYINSKNNILRIHFLDVGYGDCILIELPFKEVILIDSGPKEYSQKVIRYLEDLGISRIQTAILTHPHDNHFGGFLPILDKFSIDRFYYNGDDREPSKEYFAFVEKIKRQNIPITILKQGMELYPDAKNIHMAVLHPLDITGGVNENSMAIWLRYRKNAFLFTADIQPAQQDRVLELFPEILSADLIQIPHHGGQMSDAFISFSRNKILVVSTGPNEYGKPLEEELAKIKTNILRTDQGKPIIFESDGRKIRLVNK